MNKNLLKNIWVEGSSLPDYIFKKRFDIFHLLDFDVFVDYPEHLGASINNFITSIGKNSYYFQVMNVYDYQLTLDRFSASVHENKISKIFNTLIIPGTILIKDNIFKGIQNEFYYKDLIREAILIEEDLDLVFYFNRDLEMILCGISREMDDLFMKIFKPYEDATFTEKMAYLNYLAKSPDFIKMFSSNYFNSI